MIYFNFKTVYSRDRLIFVTSTVETNSSLSLIQCYQYPKNITKVWGLSKNRLLAGKFTPQRWLIKTSSQKSRSPAWQRSPRPASRWTGQSGTAWLSQRCLWPSWSPWQSPSPAGPTASPGTSPRSTWWTPLRTGRRPAKDRRWSRRASSRPIGHTWSKIKKWKIENRCYPNTLPSGSVPVTHLLKPFSRRLTIVSLIFLRNDMISHFTTRWSL